MSQTDPHFSLSDIIRKSLAGLLLRCPNCEKGRIFNGSLTKIEDKCAYCDVRFERHPGESSGAMMIGMLVAPVLALIGFFVTEALFDLSLLTQLVLWSVFIVLFTVLTYRNMRGLWVAVAYLTGGVYADEPDNSADVVISNPDHEQLQG